MSLLQVTEKTGQNSIYKLVWEKSDIDGEYCFNFKFKFELDLVQILWAK